jgi:flagellar assembly protein FliH
MSSLIKAGDSRITSRGVYSLDLRSISDQAQLRLADAQAQATKIVFEARAVAEAQRESIEKSAREKGYHEGLEKGRSEGREAALTEARAQFAAQHSALVDSLTSLLEQFSARREEFLVAAKRDVVVLAIAIASRIFPRLNNFGEHTEAAVDSCKEALAAIGKVTQATIRVHPDDSAALTQFCDRLKEKLADAPHLHLVDDPEVGRGGIILRTADTLIDATIATRLERIADELVTNWRSRAGELSIPTQPTDQAEPQSDAEK